MQNVVDSPNLPLSWIFYGLLFIRAPKLAARCSCEVGRSRHGRRANKFNKCWELCTSCVWKTLSSYLESVVLSPADTQPKTHWVTLSSLSKMPTKVPSLWTAPESEIFRVNSHSAWTNMFSANRGKNRIPWSEISNLSTNIAVSFGKNSHFGNLYAGAGWHWLSLEWIKRRPLVECTRVCYHQ